MLNGARVCRGKKFAAEKEVLAGDAALAKHHPLLFDRLELSLLALKLRKQLSEAVWMQAQAHEFASESRRKIIEAQARGL